MDRKLLEAQIAIAADPDPVSWLVLAGMYIKMRVKENKRIVIPEQHGLIAPLVAEYYNDPVGFVKFARGVRDSVARESYVVMHEYYRKINGSLAQQQRRERLNKAVDFVSDSIGESFSMDQRVAIAGWYEQLWGKWRVEALDDARGDREKLSSDERAQVCDEFWAEIDSKIESGLIPVPPEIVYVGK